MYKIQIKNAKIAAMLYEAVANRENYANGHTETSFGDANYSFLIGVVHGIETAFSIDEKQTDKTLEFYVDGKVILIIDRLKRYT